ncbi:hypothetical protein POM88_036786 [Heracleum sosnowskyi]|uniref:Uncharacterized protein n=1 Tax=Heracleum sosnowskyi TaxID=360622 RepID=A0AAD8HQF2_9APIA|nr:hypothetical protein POM88_036786 [Heracleum sosnowskyi]
MITAVFRVHAPVACGLNSAVRELDFKGILHDEVTIFITSTEDKMELTESHQVQITAVFRVHAPVACGLDSDVRELDFRGILHDEKTGFITSTSANSRFILAAELLNDENGSTLDPLPHLNQVVANVGELDIGAHRSRLAFLFYSYEMAKQIYGYESETDNTANVPSTKDSSIKEFDRKRKARDVKK